MKLYAAGFNAWNQLIFSTSGTAAEPRDLDRFVPVYEADLIEKPVASLTYTLVRANHQLYSAGVGLDLREDAEWAYRLSEDATGRILAPGDSSATNLTVVEYSSLQKCREGIISRSWPCPSPLKQIAAFDAGFAILYENGTVATMSDPRFEDCLGRPVDNSSPANEPGQVGDLHDLGEPVEKIATGGYTLIALTTSGSLYAWGRESTGVHRRSQAIPDLMEIPNYIEVDGDKDIKDVAVGESHALCLTAENAVFVIGSNDNGQLGLGRDRARVTAWTELAMEVPPGYECVGVSAGPRSSFILMDRKSSS